MDAPARLSRRRDGQLSASSFNAATFWDLAYRDGEHLQYWQSPEPPAELRELLQAGQLTAETRVLDLGCGAGAEAIFLARQGCRVWAVDHSREALALARHAAAEEGVVVEWIEASVHDIPLPAQSVDFAYDRGCLHLFEAPARRRYAAELARLLAPGGRLLLRGASQTDEEAGLFAVDGDSVDRLFSGTDLTRGAVLSRPLCAPAADLPAHQILFTRPRDGE